MNKLIEEVINMCQARIDAIDSVHEQILKLANDELRQTKNDETDNRN